MIPNASLMPMTRSNGRGMYNYELREFASMEYKGSSSENTASIIKDTLPLSESRIKMMNRFASIDKRCQARGLYANGCLYTFAVFGCAMFVFQVTSLFL